MVVVLTFSAFSKKTIECNGWVGGGIVRKETKLLKQKDDLKELRSLTIIL